MGLVLARVALVRRRTTTPEEAALAATAALVPAATQRLPRTTHWVPPTAAVWPLLTALVRAHYGGDLRVASVRTTPSRSYYLVALSPAHSSTVDGTTTTTTNHQFLLLHLALAGPHRQRLVVSQRCDSTVCRHTFRPDPFLLPTNIARRLFHRPQSTPTVADLTPPVGRRRDELSVPT
jgi:hypothetical protein